VELWLVDRVEVKLSIGEPEQPTMKHCPRSCGLGMHLERTQLMQVYACLDRNRFQRIGFFFVAGFAALPVLAGTPAALDHVPADAQAVVVVPNVGELLNDVNAINALMGDQGQPMIVAMTSMVRGWPGINLNGSMAGVLTFDENGDNPEGVILVPVSDFDALAQGQSAVGGVVELPMGNQVMYLRNAGDGYAVVGDDEGMVRGYDASGGHIQSHTTVLGNTGSQIAAGNDIFVFVNFDAFQDQIAAGIKELEDQGEMVEMMGGEEAAAGYDQGVELAKTVIKDGGSFAMGLNFDQHTGFSFDVGMQFKDGSTSASYLQNKGNAGKYLANAPEMGYFFASAFDLSGDGVSKLLNGYFDMIEQFDTTGMMKGMGIKSLVSGVKGGIEVMGASDNVMGGLMSKTMYYMEVDDADKYIDSIKNLYKGMDESMKSLTDAGIKVDASMDEEPTTINGVDAYGYSMAMDMSNMEGADAMGGMNPGMVMGMIFGPESGPSGYLAKAGGGLVMTMSKDAGFFTKVASAANGKDTMAGDQSIAHTAAMLPDNLISETYIGADHLANTAGPMLMMFGVIPEFKPLGTLPPVGIGVSADGGGVLLRTVLPIETIGSVMDLVAQEGDVDTEDSNADEDKGDEGNDEGDDGD